MASAAICSSADVAAGERVEHPVDLLVGEPPAVALGRDHIHRVHAPTLSADVIASVAVAPRS